MKVKQIRIHLGLTQRQFAERIGKTTGYVSGIECGKAELSPRTIQDICDTYGVNPDFQWQRVKKWRSLNPFQICLLMF